MFLYFSSSSSVLITLALLTWIHNNINLFLIDYTEDDTSILTDVKVPILKEFYRHMYNPEWHFSCKCFDISPLLFTVIVITYLLSI